MPVQDTGVGLTRQLMPIEPRTHVCGRVLRVWDLFGGPAEGRELRPAPFADGPTQLRILVIGKVLERCGGAPLLALEQQGDEGRGEDEGGSDLQAARAEEMAAALPLGAVTNLIMVLQVAEEPMA